MRLCLSGWRIDTPSRTATRNGLRVRLSPRALRLLEALVDADGEVVSRDTLLDLVWPDVTVSDESLTQVVAEVRRALREPGVVETIPRNGYRLTVPMEESCEPQPDEATAPSFSLQAYTQCLEAQASLARGGEGALLHAEALAADAAAGAPDFALARATYAMVLAKRHSFWCGGTDLLENAKAEAAAAVRLQPALAKAHLANALVGMALGNPEQVIASLEAALAQDPLNSDTHFECAGLAFTMGFPRIAAALGARAGELAPTEFDGHFIAARALYCLDPARAKVFAKSALQRAQAQLAVDPGAARARYALAPLLAITGDHDAAQADLESTERQETPLEYYRSIGFGLVGDSNSAVDTFVFIVSRGWRLSCVLSNDPSLSPLHHQPQYRQLQRDLAA